MLNTDEMTSDSKYLNEIVEAPCFHGCGKIVEAPRWQMQSTAVTCVECLRKLYRGTIRTEDLR